jgi:hypothetical protein
MLSFMKLRWRTICALCCVHLFFLSLASSFALPKYPAPALSTATLERKLGHEWTIQRIPDGYLLTSLRPVVFLPNVSTSSKKDIHQRVASARRDFLRIKIVLGAPLTHDDICNLSVCDYVLPEVDHQAALGYYPCWDLDFYGQIDYYSNHQNAPIYLFCNSGPDENTYPEAITDEFNNAVATAYTLAGFDLDWL